MPCARCRRRFCFGQRIRYNFAWGHPPSRMPYNVYLVDRMNRIVSDELRIAVISALKPYYDDIVNQAKVAGVAIVSFVAANPQPKDHDLIVYFCSEHWHDVS